MYDVLIIGGGPGGTRAAKVLAAAGKKVALISSELGGECLNYGCIPTKTYLWSAEMFEKLRENAAAFGIETGHLTINWEQMKKRRSEVVAKLKKQLAFTLSRAGVTLIEGKARFSGPRTIQVEQQTLTAPTIIIATGSQAVDIPCFEIGEKNLTNHEILDLPSIPKTLLVIGAGPIGVEFASIFAVLGSAVTVAENRDRLLPNEDPDVSSELEKIFSRKNITILKNTHASSQQALSFEKVLIAVGRRPYIDNLNLAAAQVTVSEKGITANEYMQTSAEGVYAVGDVVGRALLAYTAEREANIACEKILGGSPRPLDLETVPNTIFSLPEVASVGITEETAKKRGVEYVIGKSPASANAKALIVGNRDGFAKIIAEKQSGRLLGVHIIGEKASELIAEASLALVHKMSVHDFAQNLHSHPIIGEILREACEAVRVA